MSQYPYPSYQQPPAEYYDPNLRRLQAPARRASVLMFVICGLGLLCGLCAGAVVGIVPMDTLASSSGMNFDQARELGFTPGQFLRVVYGTMAVVALVGSLIFGVMGYFVRGGGLGAVIGSLVLTILVLILSVLQVLAGLVQAGSGAEGLIGFLIAGGFCAMLIALLIFLIQAARSVGELDALKSQSAQQYWMYHQQAYGQAGYGSGYGYNQPPPPPPPTPGPPPTADPRGGYDDTTGTT